MSQCKIHGKKPDEGAGAAWTALINAGLCGPVLTQFPILSLGNQSRALPSMNRSSKGVQKSKGGIFSKNFLRLDMLLCSGSGTHFAAIEVQGSNHGESRIEHRDVAKAKAVARMPCVKLFEMPACELEYRPRRGTSRGRQCVKESDAVSHYDSLAMEIVKYLQ